MINNDKKKKKEKKKKEKVDPKNIIKNNLVKKIKR